MNMEYRYVSIFRISGIKLPSGMSEVVIVNNTSTGTKITLQSDIDQCCFVLDRGAAIGTMMLQSFFCGEKAGSLVNRTDKEIKHIREERRRRFGAGPFVVFEFSGETEACTSSRFRDLGEFVVSYDLIDKKKIRNHFEKEIDQLLMAFFLVVEQDYEVKKVKDGIYLLDESGKIWYSFTFTISGKAVVSKPFDNTSLCNLSEYSHSLSKTVDLKNVYRLLVQSTDKDIDNLRSFLFSWIALEVFINKMFKEYEKRFFKTYIVSKMNSSAQTLFNRLKKVMKDKYNPKDKFIVISACLSDEPEKDLEEFVSAQKVRNKLTHGVRIDESNLPTEKIILLLRKFLQNHLMPTKT